MTPHVITGGIVLAVVFAVLLFAGLAFLLTKLATRKPRGLEQSLNAVVDSKLKPREIAPLDDVAGVVAERRDGREHEKYKRAFQRVQAEQSAPNPPQTTTGSAPSPTPTTVASGTATPPAGSTSGPSSPAEGVVSELLSKLPRK